MALKKRTFRSFSPPFDKSVGNNDRIKSVQFNLGTISANVTRDIFRAKSEVEIKQISLLSDTALAASDSTYYSFDVKNKTTGNLTLFATVPTTQVTGGNGAIAADTNYNLNPDTRPFLQPNDVLQLVVTKTSTPAALGNVIIIVDFEVTGQTTTTSTSSTTTTTTSSSTTTTTTTTSTTTVTTSTTVT